MSNVIRPGLYAILDLDRVAPLIAEEPERERELLLAYAQAAAESGAAALQIRAKSVPPESLFLSRLLGDVISRWGERLPIIVNDHISAAERLRHQPGVGVHLGQGDSSPVTARHHLGPKGVVGWSTHNLDQLREAQRLPIDYLGYGPVSATDSKTDAEAPVGFDGLAEACAASKLPVVAIGGLGLDDIPAVRASGARAMAVITAWLGPADDPWSPSEASMAMSMLRATWMACAPERA